MESASEVGVTLKQGYNGDLTAREAGSIGGQMVKKISPEQQYKYHRNGIKHIAHPTITYFVYIGI